MINSFREFYAVMKVGVERAAIAAVEEPFAVQSL
jgi:hypothetical protein